MLYTNKLYQMDLRYEAYLWQLIIMPFFFSDRITIKDVSTLFLDKTEFKQWDNIWGSNGQYHSKHP